jgi:hypothetical protein
MSRYLRGDWYDLEDLLSVDRDNRVHMEWFGQGCMSSLACLVSLEDIPRRFDRMQGSTTSTSATPSSDRNVSWESYSKLRRSETQLTRDHNDLCRSPCHAPNLREEPFRQAKPRESCWPLGRNDGFR